MIYDKKEIMRIAWVWAKQDLWSHRADKSMLKKYFTENLKKAWADKTVGRKVKTFLPTDRTKEEVQRDIWIFECKDTIRVDDWKVLDKFRQELVYAK